MADDADAELIALQKMRDDTHRLQNEQRERRELLKTSEARLAGVHEKMSETKENAEKLALQIHKQESTAPMAKDSLETLRQQEVLRCMQRSCAKILEDHIPGVYNAMAGGGALKQSQLRLLQKEGTTPAAAETEDAKKADPIHDVVWITHVTPGNEYYSQLTMKIAPDTTVHEILADATEYWGCSLRESMLYKGEDHPRPLTQHRILLNATMLQQRDAETRQTQKETLLLNIDFQTGRIMRKTMLGGDTLYEGDVLLGVKFQEEGIKWVDNDEPDTPRGPEALISKTVEDDQVIFQFDDSRRVQDVLSLQETAHIFLVATEGAGEWAQSVALHKGSATKDQQATQIQQQGGKENPKATRAIDYPSCLEVVRPWPGMFYDLTSRGNDTLLHHSNMVKCRDIVMYFFLVVSTLVIIGQMRTTENYWVSRGVEDAILEGKGVSDTAYGFDSILKPSEPVRKYEKRVILRRLDEQTQSGADSQSVRQVEEQADISKFPGISSRGRHASTDNEDEVEAETLNESRSTRQLAAREARETNDRREKVGGLTGDPRILSREEIAKMHEVQDVKSKLREAKTHEGQRKILREILEQEQSLLGAGRMERMSAEIPGQMAGDGRRELAITWPKSQLKIPQLRPVREIRSQEQMWDFIIHTLADQIFSPRSTLNQQYIPGYQLMIRQQRVVQKECERVPVVESYGYAIKCYEPYISADTRSKSLNVGGDIQAYEIRFHQKVKANTVQTGDPLIFNEAPKNYQYDLQGQQHLYDASGFTVWYDLKHLHPNTYDAVKARAAKVEFQEDMLFLRSFEWLGVQSRLLHIELIVKNPTYNTYADMSIGFEIKASGGVSTVSFVRAAKVLSDTSVNPDAGLMGGLDVLRVIIAFWIAIPKVYLNIKTTMDSGKKGWQSYLLTIPGIIDNILASALFLAFFARSNMGVPKSEDPSMTVPKTEPQQFLGFTYFYVQLALLETVILLFSVLQLSFVAALCKPLFQLWKIIQHVLIDYVSYSFVCGPIFFGFMAFGHAIYGSHIREFRNYRETFLTLMLLILGHTDGIDRWSEWSVWWTFVFLASFYFVIIFILMNGFLSIVVHNYNRVMLKYHGGPTTIWTVRGFLKYSLWKPIYEKVTGDFEKDKTGDE